MSVTRDLNEAAEKIARLESHNANLLRECNRYRDIAVKNTKSLTALRPLAVAYLVARDEARKQVNANDRASKSGAGTPGTGHHTPFHTLDAVREWQKAALDLAESCATELELQPRKG